MLLSHFKPFSFSLLLDLLFSGFRCSNAIRVPLSEIQTSDEPIKDQPLPPSALDEELDDSFLQEIDAICEQKSAAKEQKPEKRWGFVVDKYHEYLQKLNDEQREAACVDISVPLMIIAGPGSGKVRSLLDILGSLGFCFLILLISLFVDINYGWSCPYTASRGIAPNPLHSLIIF